MANSRNPYEPPGTEGAPLAPSKPAGGGGILVAAGVALLILLGLAAVFLLA